MYATSVLYIDAGAVLPINSYTAALKFASVKSAVISILASPPALAPTANTPHSSIAAKITANIFLTIKINRSFQCLMNPSYLIKRTL